MLNVPLFKCAFIISTLFASYDNYSGMYILLWLDNKPLFHMFFYNRQLNV